MLEKKIITFVKNELKKIQKDLSPDCPEFLEGRSEGEGVLESKEEDQGSREAFVEITLNVLRRMNQKELADRLLNSKIDQHTFGKYAYDKSLIVWFLFLFLDAYRTFQGAIQVDSE